ncbi:MAG: hypothetical protein WB800_40980 [Streptosporangiaceae bacterium]
MLGSGWTEVVALAAAFLIAALATPAGISGAVLLLPFQVSVLATPSPSVTPTNLLYNVVATPRAGSSPELKGRRRELKGAARRFSHDDPRVEGGLGAAA